ncbi:hypothetical protein Pelo_2976 [Pelomyxa schiedti]|nr:hypothetical protein Pelo_2976 [Pelomyxa schiedti]
MSVTTSCASYMGSREGMGKSRLDNKATAEDRKRKRELLYEKLETCRIDNLPHPGELLGITCVLVDGYNIIGCDPTLRTKMRRSRGLARVGLVDMVAEFSTSESANHLKYDIIFDGSGDAAALSKGGVEVLLSGSDTIADDTIVEMFTRMKAAGVPLPLLVTSDRELTGRVCDLGGKVMKSGVFYTHMMQASNKPNQQQPQSCCTVPTNHTTTTITTESPGRAATSTRGPAPRPHLGHAPRAPGPAPRAPGPAPARGPRLPLGRGLPRRPGGAARRGAGPRPGHLRPPPAPALALVHARAAKPKPSDGAQLAGGAGTGTTPVVRPDEHPLYASNLPRGVTENEVMETFSSQLLFDPSTSKLTHKWLCTAAKVISSGFAIVWLKAILDSPSGTTASQVLAELPLVASVLEGTTIFGSVVHVSTTQSDWPKNIKSNSEGELTTNLKFPVSTLYKLAPIAPRDKVWGEPGVDVESIELTMKVTGSATQIERFKTKVTSALQVGFMNS